MSETKPAAQRLSLTTQLFYGSGTIAFGVKDNGFSYFLLIFYNQVMGLPAQTVGLAIMIALVVDAFIDPIVGQVSDNWRSRWGRRHPFMYAAAIPAAVSYLLIWNPPAGWDHGRLFLYLIVTAVLIRSFITLYEIPSQALAAELTADYDERTRLLSWRMLFSWIGGLVVFFAAWTVFLRPTPEHPVGQLNPAGYHTYGIAAAALMFVAILVSAIGTHRQIPRLRVAPHREATLGVLVREMFGTLANRSFLALLGAYLFFSMAVGLVFSISTYMSTYFWEFSTRQIGFFAFSSLTAAVIAAALAPAVSRRFNKRPSAIAMIVVSLLVGAAPVVLRLLGLLPGNDWPALYPLIFVQNILSTAMGTAGAILMNSMIADVVEDSELRTGRRQEGLFFAAAAFIQKAVSGVGIFASGLLLGFVQFPQGAQPGAVAPEIIHRLGATYVPVLAVLYVAALSFLTGYRISRRSHEESLARLAAATELAEAGEPASSQAKLS
ncbi:MFS transporter [Phenylobacterium sp.]|uniref:MFS transporter n=1 Tax=Phenylobacterium sp. TaxID=1871053 RepID=UPI0035B4465E